MYRTLSCQLSKKATASKCCKEEIEKLLEVDEEPLPCDIGDALEMNKLTEKRCDIIKETWEIYKQDGINNTIKIFFHLFTEHPEYKYIWPQFRGIPDSSFILSSALRNHAEVYTAGLSIIINNMHNKAKMYAHIKKIAYAHVKWIIHQSHVQNMVPGLMMVLKDKVPHFDDSIEDAWKTLYGVIGSLLEQFKNDYKKEALILRTKIKATIKFHGQKIIDGTVVDESANAEGRVSILQPIDEIETYSDIGLPTRLKMGKLGSTLLATPKHRESIKETQINMEAIDGLVQPNYEDGEVFINHDIFGPDLSFLIL
uniref:GLOBIN domain-containing protein n=1 Tax=Rhabditophanes sp. KR3021 TaxID=114890 RepID=A0AC35U5B8_9BILA